MQCNKGKRRSASLRGGFAALCAALTVVAAAGSASAAPTEIVLHSFTGSDGAAPFAGLIADSNGNLYGTTFVGGLLSNNGVVFKLSPGGGTLHAFTGSDGANPRAGLIGRQQGQSLWHDRVWRRVGKRHGVQVGGQGFVTAIPFSAFKGKLEIEFGPSPNTDSFELKASFTLGSASNGINPPAEPVTLNVGTFTTTIPLGSFKGKGFGPFTFEGVINGVALEVRIAPTGAKRYSLQAEADSASLTGTVNPVPVTLSIGDDGGTTSIKAEIGS